MTTGDSSPWSSSVVLASGDTAFVRPITPADRSALADFHLRQSSESVYRRYFSPKPELTQRDLDHFTGVDMVDRAALVVESHGEFIGWASYERWPGRNEAEAAFMVDDSRQGEGIATLLLEHLASIARSNGIERFTAEVLGDNRAMLAVFAKAGWPLQRRFDSGVVDLDWELADTAEFIDSVERREQRADSRAVTRILLPRAVAVIGASDRTGSVGEAIWTNVAASVRAPIFAVNPAHDTVGGRRCLRSVDELPPEVSLAVIAVPARALASTIEQCIAKRMRGAVVITSVEGADVDVEAIVATARRNGLRIIGPSSMGIASPRPETELQAALVDVALPAGNVAVSMQSGSLGGSLLRSARDVGLGLSWFVSLGDKGDISANDLLQFWEEDEHTDVIAMYTESFGNPRKFSRIARRVSRSKPIVAVRTGAAGVDGVGDALFQQAGVVEVPTVPALLDTVRVLATQPVIDGPEVAVITNSRSPGTLAAAALTTAGLNPDLVVLDWSADGEVYTDAIRTAIAAATVDGVMVIYAPPVPARLDAIGSDIDAAAHGAPKPVVAVMLGGTDGPVAPGSSVPAFSFPEQPAAILGRCLRYARWRLDDAAEPAGPTVEVDPAAADALLDAALAEVDGSGVSGAPAALALTHRLLGAYGIAVAPAIEATPATAAAAADAIGYPVAVKAVERRPGRSARAGVALDLEAAGDVAEALAVISDALGADGERLVVQAMVAPGVDVRIRCAHDERLGPIVSVGLGGAQADSIDDQTRRLAPVSPSVAATMVRETRVQVALDAAGFDPGPLIDAVVLAAQLASDHPEVAALDLNPVIVSDGAAVVTDAILRLAAPAAVNTTLRRLD